MSTMTDAGRSLKDVASHQDGVLTRRDLAQHGVTAHVLRSRLRSGDWDYLLPGAYLAEISREGHQLRRAWARSAVLTVPGATLSHGSAARLHGIEGVPRSGAVDVLVPRRVEAVRRPLVPRRWRVVPEHIEDLDGLPVTSVVRTLADLVPLLDRPDGLAVLDSALHRGLVDVAGVEAAAVMAARRRGAAQVSSLWGLADGLAETPVESRSRLRCLDAGLAPRALQEEVRDDHGHLLARGDMTFERLDPSEPPLILEADGRGPHDARDALHRDRWRANTLMALGHRIVRCTWRDTCSRLTIPTMVRAAL